MKKPACRKFSSSFKAQLALEAIRRQYTRAEIARKFEINQVMISSWKGEFLTNMGSVFETGNKEEHPDVVIREGSWPLPGLSENGRKNLKRYD